MRIRTAGWSLCPVQPVSACPVSRSSQPVLCPPHSHHSVPFGVLNVSCPCPIYGPTAASFLWLDLRPLGFSDLSSPFSFSKWCLMDLQNDEYPLLSILLSPVCGLEIVLWGTPNPEEMDDTHTCFTSEGHTAFFCFHSFRCECRTMQKRYTLDLETGWMETGWGLRTSIKTDIKEIDEDMKHCVLSQ